MVAYSKTTNQTGYASPTQFKFSINFQKVEFFTVSANIPDDLHYQML